MWIPRTGSNKISIEPETDKPTNRPTDIQDIQNYFEIVYQHPWNVSKKIRNISHPELEISLYLSNFSKEVSQLTD